MKKTIAALVIIVTVSVLLYKSGFAEKLKDVELMRNWFKELGVKGYFAFVILSVFVAVFMLPGQFLAIAAGITYGGLVGGALTVVGATIGSGVSFAAAKYFFRGFVVSKFRDNAVFKKIELGVTKNGINFLIFTRLTPVFPYALQSYAYALTPIEFAPFTLISFVTMIPGCFIYSFAAAEVAAHGFGVRLCVTLCLAGVLLFGLSFVPRTVANTNSD